MSKRGLDKRQLVRLLLDATEGPDAISAMRRVVDAMRKYVNDPDVTSAVNAVLRVHCPVPATTGEE